MVGNQWRVGLLVVFVIRIRLTVRVCCAVEIALGTISIPKATKERALGTSHEVFSFCAEQIDGFLPIFYHQCS